MSTGKPEDTSEKRQDNGAAAQSPSRALHENELFLAWCDKSFANGAVAGWNAALAYAEIHRKRELAFWANNKPRDRSPIPTPFLDQINRTASEAFRVIVASEPARSAIQRAGSEQ